MAVTKKILNQYDVKRCSRCGIEKPAEEFSKDKGKKDGLSCYCRSCWSEYNIERTEQRKKYYEENREEILKKQSAYGKEHRAEITARRREYLYLYNQEHKEERNAYNREWRRINKDRIKQRKYEEGVRYRAKHKEELKNKKLAYEKGRRAKDPVYRFRNQTRIMIRDSFRRKGLKKSDATEKILGCSLAMFQEHLLQTWRKRYGREWMGEPCHIDHIVPLSSAKTEEDVARLCHYTNLQLLTPEENFEKGAQI